MRKIVVAIAMVGAGLFADSACARPAPSTAEQAIRPLMAKMGKAAAAHGAQAFMAYMLRSPSFVFAINGRVIHGWDALYAAQVEWWSHGAGNTKYAPNGAPEFMAIDPKIEIVTLPMLGRRALPDGKISTSTFVVTNVWQHLPQGWRIVYGHESWAKPPG